jgi:hypothetical protein
MKEAPTTYGCPGVKDGTGLIVEVATRDSYKAASANDIGICAAKANKNLKQIVDYMKAADEASGL